MQTFVRLAGMLSLVLLAAAAAPSMAAEVPAATIDDCRIGFDGAFKVGHWTPVWIDVADAAAGKMSVEITALDNDGVPVTTSRPVAADRPTLLYTRVGRLRSAVQVRLLDKNGKMLDRAELTSQRGSQSASRFAALPASGQLLLQIGPAPLDIENLLHDQETDEGDAVVQLVDVESLPTDWFGYDAVDIIVLTTNDAAFCDKLVADTKRFAALRDWLELGGRLVVCGGRTSPELLGPGKPFSEFVPGKITELVRLPQAQALENFAGSGDAISMSGPQQNVPLPRLVDVQGRVELFARGAELPIVVRAPRGLGELVFVSIDLSEPPFDEWTGRRAFLEAVLRPYLADADASRTKQKLVSLGYDDLAGALRQRLGRSFAGVVAIGFPWVAALVIGYLLLLGPLDYLFVERVLHRPWIAWITLPVILLGTCGAAALLAGRTKNTDSPRLNHAELVDFDLTTGRTRGFAWATLYSPAAERFDVSLAPRLPDGQPAPSGRPLVSWLGLPGNGLGGMHAPGEPIDVAGVGYEESNNLSELSGLPVLTASTKSLGARWDAPRDAGISPPITAEFTVDDDGLLVGSVINNTGTPLTDAYVLHGQWGYLVGDLRPGKRLEIGPRLKPKRVKSIVVQRAVPGAVAEQATFLADRASAEELLNVMMFYEAVGGEAFAGLPNRYQADCDLSHLLTFDRAILVAGGTNRGSEWANSATDQRAATDEDQSTVLYRFVAPVAASSSAARASTLDSQP
jgi:hypothetical protein